MNSDDKNTAPAAAAAPGVGGDSTVAANNEGVNNNNNNDNNNGGKDAAQAVDDSLVDPELNQHTGDGTKADEHDHDEDDDQINQIEDDNDNIVAAAAAAAASNDINYLANMHAVENHMQNVLGGGAGSSVNVVNTASSVPSPVANTGSINVGASAKDIKMDDNPNDADYNDDEDDDDDDKASKTAIDAVVESSKVKKAVSTTKRAAQNRAAQRAFRQRRKTRIEQLESVELLYKATLMDVERLQAENEALKKKLTEINSK